MRLAEIQDAKIRHLCNIGQIPLRYPARDQLASSSATISPAGPSARPARELDSVMEYGLNWSATRFELSRHAEIARTCLRKVGNQVCDKVCDLDSVMEFDTVFATQACIDNRKKNLLNGNISHTCPHNMVNFVSRSSAKVKVSDKKFAVASSILGRSAVR